MTNARGWWNPAVPRPVVVIAALAIGLTLQHQNAAHQTAGDSGAAAPSVPLVTVRTGDFVDRVEVQGRVGPPAGSSAKLAFAQAGIIRAIDVSVGETVTAGQTLAELDRASLGATVRGAQADAQGANPLRRSKAPPRAWRWRATSWQRSNPADRRR